MARVGTPLSKIYHSAVPLTNFENLEFSRAEMKFLARGEEDFVVFVAVCKKFYQWYEEINNTPYEERKSATHRRSQLPSVSHTETVSGDFLTENSSNCSQEINHTHSDSIRFEIRAKNNQHKNFFNVRWVN